MLQASDVGEICNFSRATCDLALLAEIEIPERLRPIARRSYIARRAPRWNLVRVARRAFCPGGVRRSRRDGINLDLAEKAALKGALAKEAEKLGAKGNDRIAAVKAWVGAKLPGDQAARHPIKGAGVKTARNLQNEVSFD